VKLSKVLCCGFLAAALAWLPGCGKGSSATVITTTPSGAPLPKMGQALANSPEMKLNAMKTPQQKATFLQDLANDSSFNPKLHTAMLEKYSKDSDADLAAAAKALLDKAQ
jgi:hypothetical protein